jgi:hypothetical protein|tara:strand:- start:48 stop:248 length:201 start_codon:yes stop_codon:yes gene_type:complete
MKLYRIKIEADVYAASDWDEIKKDLVIGYKDADGNITEKIPGKYESIKILEITNDEYTIEKTLDKD